MKKGKKIKLAINKQTIAKLDNEMLKGVKGGKELQGKDAQFLSIFHCTYVKKCIIDSPSTLCDITIEL